LFRELLLRSDRLRRKRTREGCGRTQAQGMGIPMTSRLYFTEDEKKLLKQAVESLDDGMRISLDEKDLAIWESIHRKVKQQ
jgi:hypothetical protein